MYLLVGSGFTANSPVLKVDLCQPICTCLLSLLEISGKSLSPASWGFACSLVYRAISSLATLSTLNSSKLHHIIGGISVMVIHPQSLKTNLLFQTHGLVQIVSLTVCWLGVSDFARVSGNLYWQPEAEECRGEVCGF